MDGIREDASYEMKQAYIKYMKELEEQRAG